MFNHDQTAAVAWLQALAALPAGVVLPGHGPPYRGSPASRRARPGRAPLNATASACQPSASTRWAQSLGYA